MGARGTTPHGTHAAEFRGNTPSAERGRACTHASVRRPTLLESPPRDPVASISRIDPIARPGASRTTRRTNSPPAWNRCCQLAASGSTDWEVAAQTGLAKTHVSEVLTNPIYAGRLRTGEVAAIAPIVDPSLWSTVQTRRERRRTRTPGRIVKGRYALRLACAGCGKYLFGDAGRYRHPPPTCEGFLAAKPVVRCRRARNRDGIATISASKGTATRRSGTRTRSVSCSARSVSSVTRP